MKKVKLTRETHLALDKLRHKNKLFKLHREELRKKELQQERWDAWVAGGFKGEAPSEDDLPPKKPLNRKKQEYLGETMARTIYILGANRLPDERGWTNRFKIVSNSSGSVYIIAQHEKGRYWGCSCRGYTTRPLVRNCTHLKQLGIPGGEKPYEVNIDSSGSPMRAEDTVATAPPKVSVNRDLTSLGKRKVNLD